MPTTFLGWVSFLLEEYGPLFLQGTINTMIVAITGTVLGFLIGLLIAIAKTIPTTQSDSKIKKFSQISC